MVHGQAVAVQTRRSRPRRCRSGQLEIRSLRRRWLPSSSLGRLTTRCRCLLFAAPVGGQEGDGPRTGTLRAAPPPMNRRRELSWASRRGSMRAIAGPFRYGRAARRRARGAGRESRRAFLRVPVGRGRRPVAGCVRRPPTWPVVAAGSQQGSSWSGPDVGDDPGNRRRGRPGAAPVPGRSVETVTGGGLRTGASIDTRTRSGRPISVTDRRVRGPRGLRRRRVVRARRSRRGQRSAGRSAGRAQVGSRPDEPGDEHGGRPVVDPVGR